MNRAELGLAAVIGHGAELLAQVALSTALEELLFALEQNSSSPLKAKLYRVCPPGDYFRRKLTLASVKNALAAGCDASTLSDKVFKSGLGLPPHYDVMSHFVEMCREALLDRSGEPAVTLAGGWSSIGGPFQSCFPFIPKAGCSSNMLVASSRVVAPASWSASESGSGGAGAAGGAGSTVTGVSQPPRKWNNLKLVQVVEVIPLA